MSVGDLATLAPFFITVGSVIQNRNTRRYLFPHVDCGNKRGLYYTNHNKMVHSPIILYFIRTQAGQVL